MGFSTNAEAGSEKSVREYSRVEVAWPVILHTAAGLVEGELKNASIEGALIHCQGLVDSTEPLEVSIEIPGYASPILATVEMVRSNMCAGATASPSCELAVRFLEMSEEDRRSFYAAVERQTRRPNPGVSTQKNICTALDTEPLRVVEKLAIELERSLNDLLEEAIEDLVKKYENWPIKMSSEAESDQRQHARVEVSWPVVLKASNKSIRGEVKNISSRGALVCCNELPSLDLEQTVQLQIKIPEHSCVFTVPGNLVRFDIYDRENALFRYALAFRFLELSEGNLIFLSDQVSG